MNYDSDEKRLHELLFHCNYFGPDHRPRVWSHCTHNSIDDAVENKPHSKASEKTPVSATIDLEPIDPVHIIITRIQILLFHLTMLTSWLPHGYVIFLYSMLQRHNIFTIQWWQKFHPAVTWDTGLINISVPSYSRGKLLPPTVYHLYQAQSQSWNRSFALASRRGQILLAAFFRWAFCPCGLALFQHRRSALYCMLCIACYSHASNRFRSGCSLTWDSVFWL